MNRENKNFNSQEKLDITTEESFVHSNCNQSKEHTYNKKNEKKNKKIIVGFAIFALGLGSLPLVKSSLDSAKNDEFYNFNTNDKTPMKLNFSIKEGNSIRGRTSQEMREFYSKEGEEFLKTIYPESSDSDFALLTIGKSIDKELSNLKFTTIDNKKIKLKDLKGKKIILDFALSTCPSCQEEFNYFSSKDMENEDYEFLTIFPNHTTKEIKDTFKELNLKINTQHIVSSSGTDGLNFADLNITHVPSKIYISEDGIVTYVTTNTLSNDEVFDLHYERAYGNNEKLLDFVKKE